MRLESFSDGKKRNWGFWQQESSESSWNEYGKSWVSVLKNIRTVLESSGLEGCSLLLPSPEVFFHIDCRLKNVVTKTYKYYFSIKKMWLNTFFLIDGWKPGFSSKIPPTMKTSGLGGIGMEEASIRKCCYDISWELVASGIHLCEWMSTFPADWHCGFLLTCRHCMSWRKDFMVHCSTPPWEWYWRWCLAGTSKSLTRLRQTNYYSCELPQ